MVWSWCHGVTATNDIEWSAIQGYKYKLWVKHYDEDETRARRVYMNSAHFKATKYMHVLVDLRKLNDIRIVSLSKYFVTEPLETFYSVLSCGESLSDSLVINKPELRCIWALLSRGLISSQIKIRRTYFWNY